MPYPLTTFCDAYGTQFRQWATAHLSEFLIKRFYQKVRDLFALRGDYRTNDSEFFAEVQNKLLYAVTRQDDAVRADRLCGSHVMRVML